jgi:hypothetical protein
MQWIQCMDGHTSFRFSAHLASSRACELVGERLQMRRGTHKHFSIWIYNDRLGTTAPMAPIPPAPFHTHADTRACAPLSVAGHTHDYAHLSLPPPHTHTGTV